MGYTISLSPDKKIMNFGVFKFNAFELAIIKVMRGRPDDGFTANKISDEINAAWETADKYLRSLYSKGCLVLGKKGTGFFGDCILNE